MRQSIFIFIAIIAGILFPYGHMLTFLIKYSLIVMLFFAFLGIHFSFKIFTKKHLFIAIANLLLPIIFYLVALPLGQSLALTAFVISIPPTAAAAPVLAQFMKTDVSFVTAAVLITNPAAAIFIPIVLPWLMPVDQSIDFLEVLLPVMTVVGVPLLLSILVKKISQSFATTLLSLKMISFYLFLFNVWLACGNASHFLQNEGKGSIGLLPGVLALTALVAVLSFQLGERLVKKEIALAGSLALGRKNTMFGLWLALTFLNPIVALGPICYILIQNLYNSYQIMMVERRAV
jgi:BASS family bile acid:Na+ symporter